MLPETGQYAGVLAFLLRDPEMAALLAKAPQAGRMLRPLCHLLGVQAPAFLRRGAVVAQVTPLAADVPRGELARSSGEPAPLRDAADANVSLTTEHGPLPQEEGEKIADGSVATDDAATGDGAVAAPAAQPPPQSGRSAAEEAALAYARRPGGLYFDGKRMRWS
jgi:hypothetical protein